MTKEQFKERLKSLRLQQKQFAEINGITEHTVSAWLRKDEIPIWAAGRLRDWEKYPDLVNHNLTNPL